MTQFIFILIILESLPICMIYRVLVDIDKDTPPYILFLGVMIIGAALVLAGLFYMVVTMICPI
jgi:hypothetical protein